MRLKLFIEIDTFTHALVFLLIPGTPGQTEIFGVTRQTLEWRRTFVIFHFVRVKIIINSFPFCVIDFTCTYIHVLNKYDTCWIFIKI